MRAGVAYKFVGVLFVLIYIIYPYNIFAFSSSEEESNYYIMHAAGLHENGKVDEAIIYLNKALKLTPNEPTAYWNLGNIYSKTGQYDKAIFNFKKCIKLNFFVAEAKLRIDQMQRLKRQK
jgi:tetratricopeptide (TPR) repeat protein